MTGARPCGEPPPDCVTLQGLRDMRDAIPLFSASTEPTTYYSWGNSFPTITTNAWVEEPNKEKPKPVCTCLKSRECAVHPFIPKHGKHRRM